MHQAADQTESQLESIVEGSGKVAEFLEEIAQSSREQAQATSQITEGLERIDEAAQASTASSEESASASEELAGQAQQLPSMVSQFKLDERYAGMVRQINLKDDEDEVQENKFLMCKLGNEVFGIDMAHVTDIIELQKITGVPDKDVDPAPKFHGKEKQQKYVAGLGKVGENVTILLDVEKLVEEEEVEEITSGISS